MALTRVGLGNVGLKWVSSGLGEVQMGFGRLDLVGLEEK